MTYVILRLIQAPEDNDLTTSFYSLLKILKKETKQK